MRASVIALLLSIWVPAHALTLSNDDEPARLAAIQWLQIIDSGNYKEAALMLCDYARAARDWSNYLANQRVAFGHVKHRQIADVKHAAIVAGDPQTRQHAILQFRSAFERATAVEEIVVGKTGCCWEVCDYKILPAQKQ